MSEDIRAGVRIQKMTKQNLICLAVRSMFVLHYQVGSLLAWAQIDYSADPRTLEKISPALLYHVLVRNQVHFVNHIPIICRPSERHFLTNPIVLHVIFSCERLLRHPPHLANARKHWAFPLLNARRG